MNEGWRSRMDLPDGPDSAVPAKPERRSAYRRRRPAVERRGLAPAGLETLERAGLESRRPHRSIRTTGSDLRLCPDPFTEQLDWHLIALPGAFQRHRAPRSTSATIPIEP